MMNKYSSMSFLSKIRRKKSKDESLQGKRREEQEESQETTASKSKERINEPVRCETCGTDFSSLEDFERHAREDHPDIPSKLKRRDG
jgi:hypothetical protein